MILTFGRELVLDFRDLQFIDRQIRAFRPDCIYLGHAAILSKALMPFLAGKDMFIVYDEGGAGLIELWAEKGIWFKLCDEYSSSFRPLNWIKSWFVKVISSCNSGRLGRHWCWPDALLVLFNSEFGLKNTLTNKVPFLAGKVVHSGIDTNLFYHIRKLNFNTPLVCLVPGRFEPCKGQIDAVRLLARLIGAGIDTKLVLIGGTSVDSYYRLVKNEIESLGLEERVEILQMVPQRELADMYRNADICFFPSYQRVGLSRVPLEAMACGCLVFSYGNEGSDEIIIDNETGFLARPGDYGAIVCAIKEAISNPDKTRKIAERARMEVEKNWSMQEYIDRIENIICTELSHD